MPNFHLEISRLIRTTNIYLSGDFDEYIFAINKDYHWSMEADFWKDCPLIEVVPGKVSGRPVLKNTRVPADTIAEAADLDMSAEEIASDYRLNLDDVKGVLAFYAHHTTIALVP